MWSSCQTLRANLPFNEKTYLFLMPSLSKQKKSVYKYSQLSLSTSTFGTVISSISDVTFHNVYQPQRLSPTARHMHEVLVSKLASSSPTSPTPSTPFIYRHLTTNTSDLVSW
ncbi:hypothetical protein ONS96_009971 [Cadophora gregata f. sp. sojae]|nr:hypothetical protein ONS96_009971 [Cadophora gregata f. sp. sojae]